MNFSRGFESHSFRKNKIFLNLIFFFLLLLRCYASVEVRKEGNVYVLLAYHFDYRQGSYKRMEIILYLYYLLIFCFPWGVKAYRVVKFAPTISILRCLRKSTGCILWSSANGCTAAELAQHKYLDEGKVIKRHFSFLYLPTVSENNYLFSLG